MATRTAQEIEREREAARLARRYPSLAATKQPAPVEILATDTVEVRRLKRRYPSSFTKPK